MAIRHIGFIGLGNVGGKLAGSLIRNQFEVTVRDLNPEITAPFLEAGAHWGESPKAMMEACDLVITCLPSPAASAAVVVWGSRAPARACYIPFVTLIYHPYIILIMHT